MHLNQFMVGISITCLSDDIISWVKLCTVSAHWKVDVTVKGQQWPSKRFRSLGRRDFTKKGFSSLFHFSPKHPIKTCFLIATETEAHSSKVYQHRGDWVPNMRTPHRPKQRASGVICIWRSPYTLREGGCVLWILLSSVSKHHQFQLKNKSDILYDNYIQTI